MVLMHRKDIIAQYGFDPGDELNQSVVPKGVTAAITPVPDKDKIEAPSHETSHAGLTNNMAAGAFKSFLSDPPMLAGLGYGVYYWAKRRAMGDEEGSFADGLYSEGGLERVQQHVNDKFKEIRANNPNWDDAAVKAEVERYTTTPDFFNFNTDQMIGPLRAGMKMAHNINQATGVDKTPDQENFTDDMAQTLGGILLPTGALKLGSVAKKFATKIAGEAVGKAAQVAGTVLDYTVVPGTASYGARDIGGNLAGGAVIDEAVRHGTGDPTVFTEGTALQEYFKEQDKLPPELLPPRQEAGVQPMSAQEVQLLKQATNQADEASMVVPSIVGGAVAAGLIGRRALRGGVNPSVPPANPASAAEDFAARRDAYGLNDPVDPDPLNRAVERTDEAFNRDAPLEHLSQDLGGEALLGRTQANMGQRISPHGQDATFKNFYDHGMLPDGTFVEPGRLYHDLLNAAPEDVRQEHFRSVIADNILFEVGRHRTAATDQLTEAVNNAAARPNDPALQARLAEATQINTLWQQYDPTIRRYMPNLEEQDLIRNQSLSTRPEVAALNQGLERFNRNLAYAGYRSGVYSREQYLERLQQPLHTSLFEYSPQMKVELDPREARNTSLGPATQRVHEPISPSASAWLKANTQLRWISSQIGLRNVTHDLEAADPLGREVRRLAPGQTPSTEFGSHYSYIHNGREVTVEVARPPVANALRQAPIDDGVAWNVINTVRQISQIGMVHGLAAIGQAPVSLFYDMVTGWLTQRSGRSVGYVSRIIREVERSTVGLGNSPALTRVADLVDVVDPTRLAAMGVTFAQAALLNTARMTGEGLMRQAITRDGLFGHIANTSPQAAAAMHAIGGRMATHFWASWLGSYRRFEGSRPHEMIADLNQFRTRFERDVARYENGRPLRAELRSIVNAYFGILDTVQSLQRMTYYAQNHAINRTASGRPTLQMQRILGEEARRSAGDMSGQFGSAGLRKAGKAIPFFRIGMQSFRYILHSMSSRGAWDTGLVATRFGALAGAMYGTSQMIESMGLTDWYYEQLNDFERTGKIRFPTLESWKSKIVTGQFLIDKENPDRNFIVLTLPPEASLFLGTIMYGMEQMGFLNRGSNRGNTSAEKDLLYNLSQTFNVGNIPLVSAVAAGVYGGKVDLTAGLRGRSAASEIKGSRAQLGDLPSGIPSAGAEAIKSLFGFNGMLAIKMADAGAQSFQQDQDVMKSLGRAWDEGSNIFVEKSVPGVPGLWDAHKKVHGFSAMSSEVGRVNKIVDSLNNAYTNNFTPAGMMRGANRQVLQDPELRSALALTHNFFNRGAMPKIQERINFLKNQVDDLEASKDKKDYKTVQAEQDRKMIEMKPYQDRMGAMLTRYNTMLAEKFGPIFAREKMEPTIDNLVRLIEKSSAKSQRP